jgi:hypothetical protein
MRGKIVLAGLVLGLSGIAASAQAVPPAVPRSGDIYCSGLITSESVPQDTIVITGEQSNYKMTFEGGDYIYINKGSGQGVKVGDEFSVVRPIPKDYYGIEWTKWQWSIMKKMGTVWEDEARAKVLIARPDVSIAQVENACDEVQRGDILLPFSERPVPPLKSETFDRFAPANGKPLAMVITGKKFQQQVGSQDIIYVNLGAAQGVKVGDYFRIFRFQGTQHETDYQTPRYSFDMEQGDAVKDVGIYGFGAVSKKYTWNNVPREDIGEGIVLRTGPNSATVLITFTLREIFPGDYVEVE